MATQITNYQCPACIGPLHFAAGADRLECDYCGSHFSVAEIEAQYAAANEAAAKEGEKEAVKEAAAQPEEDLSPEPQWEGESDWDTAQLNSDWGQDAANMRAYSCPSCGAQLICEATTAATACPYCGNPTVVPGQLSGALKPDYVIPFVVQKDAAVQILKNHYKGKILLPKSFTSDNQIQKIQGIYVPFWLFDGQAKGSASYTATRSRRFRAGNEEVIRTDHFHVHRSGYISFQKVPVDASSKMPDGHMDAIEPFDYSQLKPFAMAYLPGFLADKYDLSVEQCFPRADGRCSQTLRDALRNTVFGYESVMLRDSDIQLRRGKVHYALLPVWLLSTRWKGENFLFAINGQTGRVAGKLPSSWGRFFGLLAAIAVPLSVVASLIVAALC